MPSGSGTSMPDSWSVPDVRLRRGPGVDRALIWLPPESEGTSPAVRPGRRGSEPGSLGSGLPDDGVSGFSGEDGSPVCEGSPVNDGGLVVDGPGPALTSGPQRRRDKRGLRHTVVGGRCRTQSRGRRRLRRRGVRSWPSPACPSTTVRSAEPWRTAASAVVRVGAGMSASSPRPPTNGPSWTVARPRSVLPPGRHFTSCQGGAHRVQGHQHRTEERGHYRQRQRGQQPAGDSAADDRLSRGAARLPRAVRHRPPTPAPGMAGITAALLPWRVTIVRTAGMFASPPTRTTARGPHPLRRDGQGIGNARRARATIGATASATMPSVTSTLPTRRRAGSAPVCCVPTGPDPLPCGRR